jgi:hypothetical protein
VLVGLVAPEPRIDDLDDTVFSNLEIVLTERQASYRGEISGSIPASYHHEQVQGMHVEKPPAQLLHLNGK